MPSKIIHQIDVIKGKNKSTGKLFNNTLNSLNNKITTLQIELNEFNKIHSAAIKEKIATMKSETERIDTNLSQKFDILESDINTDFTTLETKVDNMDLKICYDPDLSSNNALYDPYEESRQCKNNWGVVLSKILDETPDKLGISYEGRSYNAGTTAYFNIYRNGNIVGTERSTVGTTYVKWSEIISGWSKGDVLAIYTNNSQYNIYSSAKNLTIYGKIIVDMLTWS